MNNEINKEMFTASIDKVFDRLDKIESGMNDKFEKLENHIEKIEQQNTGLSERIIVQETKFDSLKDSVKEEKNENEKVHGQIFEKIRILKHDVPDMVEAENNKQNLKIISTAVAVSGAVMGFVQFIIWVFNK